jgi:hypothetical protein
MFIYVLTRHVFKRYKPYILNHDRYIDDGFIIWTGSALLAAELFTALNALNVNIRLTFTVSLLTAVFLDLTIFKGERFKQERLLDTRFY